MQDQGHGAETVGGLFLLLPLWNVLGVVKETCDSHPPTVAKGHGLGEWHGWAPPTGEGLRPGNLLMGSMFGSWSWETGKWGRAGAGETVGWAMCRGPCLTGGVSIPGAGKGGNRLGKKRISRKQEP